MSKRTPKYKVYYGDHISYQVCYNLADVNAFVAYCLREGTCIHGICRY